MANGSAVQFLSMKEIVAELGVSYDSFRRKIARGEGPKHKRYGNKILIRKDWYDKWVNTNEDI
jgi:excisionase family DNA binding protein